MTQEQLLSIVVANTRRLDKVDLITRAFTMGLSQISQRHTFKSLYQTFELTLEANGTVVTLPDGVSHVRQVRLIDIESAASSNTLDLRTEKWVTDRFPSQMIQTPSRPAVAYETGGTLVFVPPANKQYTIEVMTIFLFPKIDEAVGMFPTTLDEALVAYATAYVFKSTQQYEDAQFWNGEYEKALVHAIRQDRRNSHKHDMEGQDYDQSTGLEPYLDPFAKRDW